jgi:lysyl-tRNA synthetase class 1
VPDNAGSPISYAMLLNLASVANADSAEILWGFIRRYTPTATPETEPYLARLVEHAVAYYKDFVRAKKQYRAPTPMEVTALADLAETLRGMDPTASAETIQTAVFEVGKRHPFPALKDWFACLYQVLLGQAEGPRFGVFVAVYGLAESVALIDATLTARAA